MGKNTEGLTKKGERMKVFEIMDRWPVTVTPEATLRDIVQLMLRFHLNDVLVIGEDAELAGVVTYKDIFRKLLPDYSEVTEEATRWTNPEAIEDRLLDVAKLPATEIMTTHLHTVSPETSAVKAGSLMSVRQVKQLPVVDKDRLVGVVSYRDIMWGLMARYHKGLYHRRT